ncbi:transposase, mutator type [Bifidobacterium bifidum LMG 13195]|nr:transposase, mutator type [Bifidobacterium bifidum LMG 13195]
MVGDRCAGLVSTVRSMLPRAGYQRCMGGGAVLLDFFILAF